MSGTIGCDISSEPSHRDSSDEGSQHMVNQMRDITVKILKFGTHITIAIIVLKLVKFDVTLH